MPDGLFNTDPMIAQNFFLEVDGGVVSTLTSVSGLDIEVAVAKIKQSGKDGKSQEVKTLAGENSVGDLSMTRMAPAAMEGDKLWEWFNAIRTKGFKISERESARKNGSIVIYDSANTEVARFNFFQGWPSKIATDQLSVESTDPVKETITLTIERLERVK